MKKQNIKQRFKCPCPNCGITVFGDRGVDGIVISGTCSVCGQYVGESDGDWEWIKIGKLQGRVE